MLREGFHHIRGNALMALSFIRRSFPVGLGLFLVGALGLSGLPPTQQERAAHAGVAHAGQEAAQSWYFLPYPARGQGRLPLAFIENQGQVDEKVKFYVRNGGLTAWLTDEGVVFDLLRTKDKTGQEKLKPPLDPVYPKLRRGEQQEVERERLVFTQIFLGANKTPTIEAKDPQPGIYNYFLGNDPLKWRVGVRAYADVVYRNLWDGIDLKLYGNGRDLEQEFIVRPGGDLSKLKVAYRGVEGLQVAEDGSLIIKTAFGELKESKPRIYQEIDGKRVEVAGRFKPLGQTVYTFEVGSYQSQYALVIDPTLIYSTYLGGSSLDSGEGIAVDSSGNAYVTGWTESNDFPLARPFQATYAGGYEDVFVTKLNASGGLIYSTYLGGSSLDSGEGIAVDSSGNAYVTGWTRSNDFPLARPFQATHAGDDSDVFVTKLNASGGLVYSTYLGGSSFDFGRGIAVDSSGNAYVTGDTDSDDFPMARPLQAIRRGDRDAFIAKVIEAEQGVVNSRVHIFYYPWYGNPRTDGRWVHWQQNNHVPPDDIASNYFPKLGAYSSNDRAVVDQHMAWIAQAGVGVVVTSWWGQGSYEDQAVPMLLDSAAAHGLKVAFHIEPYRGRTPDSVKGDIAYIYNRYGRHPAFFRVSRPTRYGSWANPRGVFYIFNSLATPANEWRAMLDSIRGTSLDAFVLAQTSDARLIDSGHFDGLYTYDVFNVDGSFFQGVNQAVVNRGAVFAPSVGPGYIDTRAVAGSTRNKPRLNGATYDQMWQRAIASGAEWITITSFNEWHEGTQIEPAVPKSIPGFTYLNYEGAYGLRGAQAELAYIERTRQMVDLFTERRTRLGVTTHSPRRNRWVRRR